MQPAHAATSVEPVLSVPAAEVFPEALPEP